jgi:benzoyl-CoA reductase/2-hydroxyglutaryl-CoA dehydratase subunit BcrC/BadD/HgdB
MKLEQMADWFQKRLEFRRAHPTNLSEEYYIETMKDYFSEVLYAKAHGKPLAWISPIAPVEIFRAMDIVHFGPDQYAIQVLAQKTGYEYLDLGAGVGFSTEGCSPNRAVVGMAKAGILPPPDIIVGVGTPCDSNVMMFEVVSSLFGCPTYYFDYPYRFEEASVDYLKAEVEGLVMFLEEHTGKKLDMGILEESLTISKQSQELVEKIQDLRKIAPCPFTSREALSLMALRLCSEGQPNMLKALKALYDEGQERATQGQGAMTEERHRLAWMGGFPFSEMNLLDWLEKKHGAVIVSDGLGLKPWDGVYKSTHDPFEKVARRMLCFGGIDVIYGTFGLSLNKLIKQWQDSQIDSAIYFCHFGCKQMCGISRIVVDALKEKIGIAPLLMGGDSCDARITSGSEIKEKITEYYATVVAH